MRRDHQLRIPACTVSGRPIVCVAGWARHVSLYPVPAVDAALDEEPRLYRAGRGTLRFPLGGAIPAGLVEQVVALLLRRRLSADP